MRPSTQHFLWGLPVPSTGLYITRTTPCIQGTRYQLQPYKPYSNQRRLPYLTDDSQAMLLILQQSETPSKIAVFDQWQSDNIIFFKWPSETPSKIAVSDRQWSDNIIFLWQSETPSKIAIFDDQLWLSSTPSKGTVLTTDRLSYDI